MLPPVMGSMLEFGTIENPEQLRIYLSGDTVMVQELRQIPVRFPGIDAGVQHLGGTTPAAGQWSQ